MEHLRHKTAKMILRYIQENFHKSESILMMLLVQRIVNIVPITSHSMYCTLISVINTSMHEIRVVTPSHQARDDSLE